MASSPIPYLNARREWDERYGDAIHHASQWRRLAFFAVSLSMLSILGVLWLASQSQIKPYVIALDKLGAPIGYASPVTAHSIDNRITEAMVANWIWQARSVLPEPVAQKAILERVYAQIGPNAVEQLDEWYKAHSPFNQDGLTINPSIMSVLPISKNTWQVTWSEKYYHHFQLIKESHWKAHIITGQSQELTNKPKVMLYNPLGIFINQFSWTEVLSN
ncbi:MAG: conjugal transfer protein [Ferrovum sp. 37-45-19]|jgi:type IV secretion system protein VirB5|uniref:VirB8/TrbF family protein n=1 Tax=Ferrovum sp. JA12 TaxID=1356299 RepID=UPI0007036040|nr:VirB8/TrbF family protein [Ferrovum sp. JA12]OYV79933.1 MAG: conjugal transfer protein [Ferrovum sp. 21-44-67]OYV95558.1 MAG: conjugal transfer protein [Ferrovum sp. 37-45-19]OZB31598.1 MAG: conjugal transfer protein [Ferrovum sp. 34-44-207]HQT81880.1 VirB8/TrbF family protein [Ferrovaceae bacterium]KRH78248.1 VirB8 protein [Ferrovum sp. JA12]